MTPEERALAVLEAIASYIRSYGMCVSDLPMNDSEAVAKMSKPVAAAIREAVAEERERCAGVAENGSFIHDDAPTARFGREVAAAIRRGK